ncbi:hypothetical protein CR162_16495 [Pseudoroseomonas rhizosphaerae]|uniref:Uncharacterized protein n=1 Tax=Teichococcus rhizosphaerae TaxID=1335062 RepID=A0A2C7AB58_9PROT|nr:hypothetical protein [Pseudoroseomonas rhizosphaerae]PHK93867.1 hypothetical protein CR162_16495 [Pseudoroseomonas rhizosphaerae]
MRDDYQRFANLRFLRTVDPDLLKRFLERHAIPADALDLDLLASDPGKGREAVSAYLLRTPKDRCPESLTADLHRIERLGKPVGQDALLQEARRRGVELVPPEALSKTNARNLALRAFIYHPEVFEDAENGLAFLQPASVMEFVAPEEGIPADLSEDRLRTLEAHAKTIFQADLRGEFCEAITYQDGDEVHVSIRHGAALTITEVLEGSRKRIRSFREIDNAVLAYSAIDGRLKIWGCGKASRTALAKAFAEVVLDRPGLFSAVSSRRLYTLEPAEKAGGAFEFRHRHDPGIARVQIYEAQANRVVVTRNGREKVVRSLIARESDGNALQALHDSRPEIIYQSGGWRLAHLVIKIILVAEGPRPPVITVKIKPHDTLSFPRQRHQRRVMKLLAMNEMLHEREPSRPALAAE